MKRLLISVIFLSLSLFLISQNRIIEGYAYDNKTGLLIKEASLRVENLDTTVFTDQTGIFRLYAPKETKNLIIEMEGYEAENIPIPDKNSNKRIWIGFQTNEKSKPIKLSTSNKDSEIRYKNYLTLSPLELITGAVAIRYERRLAKKHSIGLHSSFYLFGRNPFTIGSEHDFYVKYMGFKLSPFYRFYPLKSNTLFFDAKFAFGYIHFNELDYHYGSNSHLRKYIEYNFSSYGAGISVGIALKLPATEHGIINISVGYQYFPIDVPETIPVKVDEDTTISLETDTYWWYMFGPGARFDLKFTIGGIF